MALSVAANPSKIEANPFRRWASNLSFPGSREVAGAITASPVDLPRGKIVADSWTVATPNRTRLSLGVARFETSRPHRELFNVTDDGDHLKTWHKYGDDAVYPRIHLDLRNAKTPAKHREEHQKSQEQHSHGSAPKPMRTRSTPPPRKPILCPTPDHMKLIPVGTETVSPE